MMTKFVQLFFNGFQISKSNKPKPKSSLSSLLECKEGLLINQAMVAHKNGNKISNKMRKVLFATNICKNDERRLI
jgi:hypothetical protein